MAEEDNTGGGCDVSASPDVTVSFPGEKEFECKICNNCFDLDRHTPKVLECSHTFCRQCLDALQSQEGGGWRVGCPVCRHQTPVPEHGVHDLPENRALTASLPLQKHESADSLHIYVPMGPAVCSATPPESNDKSNTFKVVAFVTSCVFALLSFLAAVGSVYLGFVLYTSQGIPAIYAYFFWTVAGVLAWCSLAFLNCVRSSWKYRP